MALPECARRQGLQNDFPGADRLVRCGGCIARLVLPSAQKRGTGRRRSNYRSLILFAYMNSRRQFLYQSVIATGGLFAGCTRLEAHKQNRLFKISLAEWSLHKEL